MRISIVLATCNGVPRLQRQLASLTLQSRLPNELVVFDDASADATLEILQKFAAEAPFPVRVHSQRERVGTTLNFQSAIAASEGEIIALCDQDDVWHPDKLQRVESEFAADPSLDMVFCDADIVDDNLQPMGHTLWDSIGFNSRAQRMARRRGLASVLVRFNAVSGAGLAFAAHRRPLLLPIGPGWMHDGWIALILAAVGRCRWIDQPLWAYRQHVKQQIGAGPRSLRSRIHIARQMDGAYFDRLVGNFTVCADRIAGSNLPGDGLAMRQTLNVIRTKIEHCRARRDMRVHPAVKPLLILREAIGGRYAAASLGYQSILQDLFFA
jgi:glycosyltransferase involved in cell wall biosynthesis